MSRPSFRRSLLLGALFLRLAGPARSEQLPLRAFTSADGLAGDLVQCLAEDPRGFLWIGTSTGLSRFDGYGFTNFSTLEGLPHPSVEAVLVGRDGTLWLGTPRGLVRFRERPGPDGGRFDRFSFGSKVEDRVVSLAEGPDGRIWVGSLDGLWVLDGAQRGGGRPRLTRIPLGRPDERIEVRAMAVTPRGDLWIATSHGLASWSREGRRTWYAVGPNPEGWDVVRDLVLQDDLLWLAHDRGIFALRLPLPPPLGAADFAAARAGGPAADRKLPETPGEIAYWPPLPSMPKGAGYAGLRLSARGGLWVSTSVGLLRFDGRVWRHYGAPQGLSDTTLTSLVEDTAGNLWIASEKHGVLRLAGSRFVSYGAKDGLVAERVASVFEDRDGQMVAVSGGDGRQHLYLLAGDRFEEVTPPALEALPRLSWGWNQVAWQDRQREWWLPTGQGLLRFPAGTARELRSATPIALYGRRHGLPSADVFRLFEDSRGDLWIGLLDSPNPMVRWRRRTGAFEIMPNLPMPSFSTPTAFAEDAAGNVWIGFYRGGLARWNEASGLRHFPPGPELPDGFVHDLLIDRRGSLWLAASNGAARVDDLLGAEPRFTRYRAAGGLAHDSVRALGEDGEGRIYLGSARGFDRLEPRTGRIESFTTNEGLANNILSVISSDRRGEMWIGTLQGLSRLRPGEPGLQPPPPRIFLTGVEVAGVRQIEPGSVEPRWSGFELTPDGNRLQVEYAGVSLASGASLRYETRLVGLEPGWSAPSANRSVLLAGLAPGRYRFQVRAVTGSGVASVTPAEVAFRVLPPLWRRAWFLALVALALALAAWLAHRYRVARLLALERMRTRIASDLHDEVGASLSRVSILSEVAKLRLGPDSGSEAGELLTEIGESSRQLSESMSEIVWALDPRKDSLPSLVARLRRFASDILEAQGVALEFEAPPAGADLNLDSAERRELYLLIKEAVHNAAKHARARQVAVRLAMAKGSLRVEVRDDGAGLPAALLAGNEESGGLGLASMRQRAALLGGKLRIEPAPGGGTSVSLEMPLSARRRTRRSR